MASRRHGQAHGPVRRAPRHGRALVHAEGHKRAQRQLDENAENGEERIDVVGEVTNSL